MTYYEDALKIFTNSQQKTTWRGEVAQPDNSGFSWIKDWVVKTDGDAGQNLDVYWIQNWSVTQPGRVIAGLYGMPMIQPDQTVKHYTVVGAHLDWGKLNATDGPLYKFAHQSADILGPLLGQGHNDTTNVWSFDAAGKALNDTDTWLQNWKKNFTQWADGIDVPMSDWQGSAAGEFKALLMGFASQLNDLSLQLRAQQLSASINNSRLAMGNAINALDSAFQNWKNSPLAYPQNAFNQVFNQVMSSATVTYPNNWISISTSMGDPSKQDFWNQLETKAKQLWLNNIANILDPASTSAIGALNNAYNATSSALPQTIQTPPMRLPTPPPLNPNSNLPNVNTPPPNINVPPPTTGGGGGANGLGNPSLGGGGGNGLGGANLLGANGPGGANGLGNPSLGGGGANGLGGANLLGANLLGANGPGGANGLGNPSLGGGGANALGLFGARSLGVTSNANGLGTGNGLGGPGSTSHDMVIGPNGSPVLGSNGAPILVPSGSRVNASGTVTGPDGKPVLDSNGRPITVPAGSTLQPAATVVDANGKPVMGAHGPLTVPSGSTVSANGTVIGPNGKPILGSNGSPLTAPPGSSVVPGTGSSVLNGLSVPTPHVGSNGAPLINSSLPSTVDPLAGLAPPQQNLPTVTSLPSTTSGAPPSDLFSGAGGLGPPRTVAAANPSLVPPTGDLTSLTGTTVGSNGSQLPGVTTGVSPRMSALAGLPDGPAGLGASGLVSEPAGTATPGGAGMPFMPPMGGMGGTGGMGGGQPERQRNTWLAEDEEVWGTSSEAPPGVIGRRRRRAAASRQAMPGAAFATSSAEALYGKEHSEEGVDEFTVPGSA